MKKIITAALVMLLIAAFSVTCFAAAQADNSDIIDALIRDNANVAFPDDADAVVTADNFTIIDRHDFDNGSALFIYDHDLPLGYTQEVRQDTIGSYVYTQRNAFQYLNIYYDGDIYSLSDAYTAGIIDNSILAEIAKLYPDSVEYTGSDDETAATEDEPATDDEATPSEIAIATYDSVVPSGIAIDKSISGLSDKASDKTSSGNPTAGGQNTAAVQTGYSLFLLFIALGVMAIAAVATAKAYRKPKE